MKKTILDVMSTEHSHMNPNFKASLRSSLIAAEKRNSKRQSKHARSNKLWLIPVSGLLVALLLVTLGLNLNKPTTKGGPFKAETVSAAQLIQKSDGAINNGIGNNTYFRFTETIHFGPAAKTCDAGSYLGDTESSYINTGYRDPSGKIEAGYVETKGPDGTVISSRAMYDDTDKQIYDGKEFSDTPNYKSLTSYFAGMDLSDNVVKYLSDRDGNRIDPSQEIKATEINGVSAYTVYAISNPASKDGQVLCWPAGSNRDSKSAVGVYLPATYEPTISEIVLDSHNYTILREATYRGKVAPENLLSIDDRSDSFRNLPTEQALRLMEKDGFDKTKASDSLQGKD